jgi:hypothetical protein
MAIRLLREFYPHHSSKKGRNGVCYDEVDLSQYGFMDKYEESVKIYHGISESGYAEVIVKELQEARSGELITSGALPFLPFAVAFYRRRNYVKKLPGEPLLLSSMMMWSLRETLRQIISWHKQSPGTIERASPREACNEVFYEAKLGLQARGISQERHPTLYYPLDQMETQVRHEWDHTADILDTFVNKQTCPSTGLIRSAFGEQPEEKP